MPQSKRAAKQQALFMRRSYSAYRDIRKRAGVKELPYTLAELRDRISKALEWGICPYLGNLMGEKVTAKNFSLDHAVPTSRGGAEIASNIVVCSRSANLAKGTLTGYEFQKVIEVLETLPEEARRDVIGRLKAGAAVIRLKFLGGKKE